MSRPDLDVAGRVPPHNLDAEAAVLSAVMLSQERLADVAGWLRPEHFYADANARIFRVILEVAEAGRPVDLTTVAARLRDLGQLAGIGGPSYLAQLADATPAVAHVSEHAGIVVEKARLREYIATCQRHAAEGYTAADADAFMAAGVAELAKVADDGSPDASMASGVELVDRLFARWQNPNPSPPLRTGLHDLDRHLRGLRPKQLIIVGAHSGIGKSALAANIASHVVMNERRDGKPSGVLVFTLEMGADEYIERMACTIARLDSRKLDDSARHELTEEEGRNFIRALKLIRVPHLLIDDRADITPAQIRSKARRAAANLKRDGAPLRLVVIDYAQIVSASTDTKRRTENREQEVAVIGREAKKLAKELDVPVLLLAQLNDDANKTTREGKPRKPQARDLRESKALLQDADKVILIHNPNALARAEAYANGSRSPVDENTVDEVDIIVGKHRGGAPFTVRAAFWPAFTAFGSVAHAAHPPEVDA